jgi:hypothetical protein
MLKNMFADGGHLGWRSGSPDIILKVDFGADRKSNMAARAYNVF